MENTEPGHPNEYEFSLRYFIAGPIRRFFVDIFTMTPIVFLSFAQLYVFIMTWTIIVDHYFYQQDELLPSYVDWQNVPKYIQLGFGLVPFVMFMYDVVFFVVYLGNISI